MRPVVVTGTGRCGSSTVARLLHEELGVSMGDRFDRPRPPNPQGSFEDLDFRDLHVAVQRGELEREAFEDEARALVERRRAEHGDRWGFKDPRACYFLSFYMTLLPDASIVVPMRRPEAVARSIARHYGTPFEQAEFETQRRATLIEDAFNASLVYGRMESGGVSGSRDDGRGIWLILDMNEHRTDEWLVEQMAILTAPGTA